MKTIKRTIACTILLLLAAACPAAAEEITLSVNAGWNLVSFWFATDTLFTQLNDEGLELYSYTPDSEPDNYSSISASNEIVRGNAYWLKSPADKSISIQADVYDNTPFSISLSDGWNLLGNPFGSDIETDKISISGQSVMRKLEILNNQIPIYYDAEKLKEADGPLKKGAGFWLYSTIDSEINFTPPDQALLADAGDDVRCIMGLYYTPEWTGTINVWNSHDVECELDGSNSYDPNGGSLSYEWTQISGDTVTILNPDSANSSFIPQNQGSYTFQLSITDGVNTATDSVEINTVKVPGKIVFHISLDQDGSGSEIYTVNADGTGLQQLTDNSINDHSVSWSPDGSKIAFSNSSDGDTEIYSINATGSNLIKMTDSTYSDTHPDWASDGNIIFDSDRIGSYEVFQMDSNGDNVQKLTSIGKSYINAVGYSFDYSKIVICVLYGGDNWEILVMDSDGSNLMNLTNDNFIQVDPAWTADNRILFNERPDFLTDPTFYVMNADGTNKQEWKLPDGVAEIDTPMMTGDGQYIIYTDEDAYMHIMCADGTCDSRIGYAANSLDYHPGP